VTPAVTCRSDAATVNQVMMFFIGLPFIVPSGTEKLGARARVLALALGGAPPDPPMCGPQSLVYFTVLSGRALPANLTD
jgi:hypothetical protein